MHSSLKFSIGYVILHIMFDVIKSELGIINDTDTRNVLMKINWIFRIITVCISSFFIFKSIKITKRKMDSLGYYIIELVTSCCLIFYLYGEMGLWVMNDSYDVFAKVLLILKNISISIWIVGLFNYLQKRIYEEDNYHLVHGTICLCFYVSYILYPIMEQDMYDAIINNTNTSKLMIVRPTGIEFLMDSFLEIFLKNPLHPTNPYIKTMPISIWSLFISIKLPAILFFSVVIDSSYNAPTWVLPMMMSLIILICTIILLYQHTYTDSNIIEMSYKSKGLIITVLIGTIGNIIGNIFVAVLEQQWYTYLLQSIVSFSTIVQSYYIITRPHSPSRNLTTIVASINFCWWIYGSINELFGLQKYENNSLYIWIQGIVPIMISYRFICSIIFFFHYNEQSNAEINRTRIDNFYNEMKKKLSVIKKIIRDNPMHISKFNFDNLQTYITEFKNLYDQSRNLVNCSNELTTKELHRAQMELNKYFAIHSTHTANIKKTFDDIDSMFREENSVQISYVDKILVKKESSLLNKIHFTSYDSLSITARLIDDKSYNSKESDEKEDSSSLVSSDLDSEEDTV